MVAPAERLADAGQGEVGEAVGDVGLEDDREGRRRLVRSSTRFLDPPDAVAATASGEVSVIDARPMGAAYLAVVCLIPEILISYAAVPFYFGGTSLLIVSSVTIDTVAQAQGHLLAHQYQGPITNSKFRGRRK